MMIACAEKGCLASVSWLGPPSQSDKPLVELAKERGWRLFEGSGWKCPKHSSATTTKDSQ